MRKRAISEVRRFSLKEPVREALVQGEGLTTYVLHLEAGQRRACDAGEATYQVLEGDAVFRGENGAETARKGSVLVGRPTEIENLGGGLLVILETRAGG